jgi:hypothetical protein
MTAHLDQCSDTFIRSTINIIFSHVTLFSFNCAIKLKVVRVAKNWGGICVSNSFGNCIVSPRSVLYCMSEVKAVSVYLESKTFHFPELQITSSWQQYRRFVAGIMYAFVVLITILFAICCCLAIRGKLSCNQLFRSAGYQAYYYLLGSKGILEDYVYARNNKTRKYIYNVCV